MSLLRLLGVASVAVVLVGCPELAMKGVIKSLVAPANVLNLKVTNGGSKQFKVTWTDPADTDVDHIEISLMSPFGTDAPPPPVNVPVGAQAATITTPFNSVQYVVIVKTVDKAGNKSPGAIYGNVSLQGNPSLPSTQAEVKTLLQYSNVNLTSITGGTNYSYKTDGTLKEKDFLSGPGLTANGYTAYTYVSGQLTNESTYNSGSTLTSNYVYHYDSNGNMTEQIYYNPPGTPSESHTYEYDANGNLTRDGRYNGVGTLISSTTYGYDSNNRIVSLMEQSVKLVLKWDPTTNFLSRADFYISGNFLEYITWQITPGQQMVQAAFNPDGTPAGTSQTTTYDSHGFIQEVPYGTAPDGSSTSGPSDHTYDSNGNLSTEKDYDSTPTFYQGWSLTYY